ncbi:MAG TPA: UDP-N-acetylglucosamine--LPS N-acetylglucosamine transferase [Sphingomonas sp.]|jgi:UDP-N-acetylglucosamine:LPS N-acetylglucosamine transferase|nr:UDP-N-acetylglucosamine--LPS N-acetylglucosamine transferase [Sphingomonas sp.]
MKRAPRLLAIASSGGHWTQLQRLRPAFAGFDVAFVSMYQSYAETVAPARYYTVPDASRLNPGKFAAVFAKAMSVMAKERPSVIVTTGSMPMLAFIILGRLSGAKTLWIDSIANSERMSSSGRLARKLAHRTLSQWPKVAAAEGVECWGAVI